MKDDRSIILRRCIAFFLLVLLICALFCALSFRNKNYGGATINEMLFHLQVPLEGTNTSDFKPLLVYVPISLGISAVLTWLFYMLLGRKKDQERAHELVKERLDQAKAQGLGTTRLQAVYDGRKMTKEEKKQAKAERKQDRATCRARVADGKGARREKLAQAWAAVKGWFRRVLDKIHDGLLTAFPSMRFLPALAAGCLGILVVVALCMVNVFDFIANFFRAPNTVYEEYYVDPRDVEISFSDPDRNILWILCESMEVTYEGSPTGGAQVTDYIPELTAIQESDDSVTFRDAEGRPGAKSLSYTDWTMAAIVAQTSGINLQIADTESLNGYGKTGSFLPGDYSMGEILAERGYTNEFICGSDVNFGGRDSYFIQHGDYRIWDYYSAVANGDIPYSYYVFWGYEDFKLFEYTKRELTQLASEDAPFNCMVLTVDSHYPKGWNDKNSLDNYQDTYLNAVNTSSFEIQQFLDWCKTQDWYENTTIVISGDHPSMGGKYIKSLDPDYDRRVYFTILNSATEQDKGITHAASTFDIFPTALAAMGAQIEGDRLGLGVNLYSDEQTLLDEYGYEVLRKMMDRQSEVYYDWFFMGKRAG